jgi:hypothetical protein
VLVKRHLLLLRGCGPKLLDTRLCCVLCVCSDGGCVYGRKHLYLSETTNQTNRRKRLWVRLRRGRHTVEKEDYESAGSKRADRAESTQFRTKLDTHTDTKTRRPWANVGSLNRTWTDFKQRRLCDAKSFKQLSIRVFNRSDVKSELCCNIKFLYKVEV